MHNLFLFSFVFNAVIFHDLYIKHENSFSTFYNLPRKRRRYIGTCYFLKYLYIISYIYPSKNKWIINYSHSSQCIEKRKWSLDLSSTHASFGQNVSLAKDLKLRSSVKLKCFCRLAIVLALPDLTSCPLTNYSIWCMQIINLHINTHFL